MSATFAQKLSQKPVFSRVLRYDKAARADVFENKVKSKLKFHPQFRHRHQRGCAPCSGHGRRDNQSASNFAFSWEGLCGTLGREGPPDSHILSCSPNHSPFVLPHEHLHLFRSVSPIMTSPLLSCSLARSLHPRPSWRRDLFYLSFLRVFPRSPITPVVETRIANIQSSISVNRNSGFTMLFESS